MSYAKKPVADEAAYQRKLATTREHLSPEMDLLEFGCGTGSTAIAHAPYVRHIRAIDFSSKMIEIARGKADTASIDTITFERSTLGEFSAPDQSFDAVLGLSILHLLEDRDTAIANVHRMLKPGGLFFTSTPCMGDTLKIFKLVGPIGEFFGVLPLLRVFTVRELEGSLTEAGFAIESQWQPAKGDSWFHVLRKGG